jgi:hypothetical protein
MLICVEEGCSHPLRIRAPLAVCIGGLYTDVDHSAPSQAKSLLKLARKILMVWIWMDVDAVAAGGPSGWTGRVLLAFDARASLEVHAKCVHSSSGQADVRLL